MSNRTITHILRNSNVPNRMLPNSPLAQVGEPILNTADGKLFFRGFISGTGSTTFTPYVSDGNYFEVGSHLTRLALDDKIISYSGISGAGLNDKFLSGTTGGFVLVSRQDVIDTVDSYVSAATFSQSAQTLTIKQTLNRPDVTVTGISFTDTYVTGFTYTPATSLLTIRQNTNGLFSAFTTTINQHQNLSAGTLNLSGLNTNSIIYTDSNRNLKTDTNFTYDDVLNYLRLPDDSSLYVGSGGTVIGFGGSPTTPGVGDLVVHGNLTVFGQSISALTSELYVEDSNIILNYSSGSSISTSLGAGVTIQDGLGVNGANNDVYLQIAQSGVPTTINEAYLYRFLESNLFNLMLGSSGGTGTGFYVLKEQDILNGGTY